MAKFYSKASKKTATQTFHKFSQLVDSFKHPLKFGELSFEQMLNHTGPLCTHGLLLIKFEANA